MCADYVGTYVYTSYISYTPFSDTLKKRAYCVFVVFLFGFIFNETNTLLANDCENDLYQIHEYQSAQIVCGVVRTMLYTASMRSRIGF